MAMNKKENKEKKVNKNEGEERTVSFIELFKYDKTSEKIMIFIAVICTILQGFTMPLMFVYISILL